MCRALSLEPCDGRSSLLLPPPPSSSLILKEVPRIKETRPEARPGGQEARPGGPPVSIIGRKPAEEARPGRPDQSVTSSQRYRGSRRYSSQSTTCTEVPRGTSVNTTKDGARDEARNKRPEARDGAREKVNGFKSTRHIDSTIQDSSVNEVAEVYEAGERSLQMSQDTVNKN